MDGGTLEVRELIAFMNQFNEANGTNAVPFRIKGEIWTPLFQGSFVLGAKIGQGFYQNIRGNYDPLTMDIWWMRMPHRLRSSARGKQRERQGKEPQEGRRHHGRGASTELERPMDVERKFIRDTLNKLGENKRVSIRDPGTHGCVYHGTRQDVGSRTSSVKKTAERTQSCEQDDRHTHKEPGRSAASPAAVNAKLCVM